MGYYYSTLTTAENHKERAVTEIAPVAQQWLDSSQTDPTTPSTSDPAPIISNCDLESQ